MTKTKKKIKVYRDQKGQYLKLANGRRVRIKSKRPLSERELIQFLIKHLKPRRRSNSAKLKGVKHIDKADAFVLSKTPTIDNSKLSALETKLDRLMMTTRAAQRPAAALPAPQLPAIPAPQLPALPPPIPPRPNAPRKAKPRQARTQAIIPEKNTLQNSGAELQKQKTRIIERINKETAKAMEKYDYNSLKSFFTDARKNFTNDADKKVKGNSSQKILAEVLARNGQYVPQLKRTITEEHQEELDEVENKLQDIEKRMSEIDKETGSKKLNYSDTDAGDEKEDDDDDDVENAYIDVPPDDERKNSNSNAAAAAAAAAAATSGSGENSPEGMTDAQLNDMMKTYTEYIGTIAHNEIPTKILPKVRAHSRGCFIINTDPAHKSGQHWQAVFYDARRGGGSNSIEFYDSYADPPSKTILQGIKHIVEKLDAPTYLKYKENKIRQQNDKSSNCGYFCAKFLMDRLRGKPFSECTGYDDSVKAEKNIETFKRTHNIKEFPYIGKNGKGIVDFFKKGVQKVKDIATEVKDRVAAAIKGVREHGSPAVRKFLEKWGNEPIVEAYVARKPLASMITKMANWLTNGVFDQNRKNLNYDDIYHLYLVVKFQNGLYVRVEKNHVVEFQIMTPDPSADQTAVAVRGDTTLNSLFQKGEELAGKTAFWTYHPINNNCQYFIRYLLKGSGMWNSALEKFVMQDAQGLVKNIESVGDTAASVTDLAGRLDILLRGKGRRFSRRSRR